jgi:glycosyltransferase involved in cell wall biosynthesis
MPTKGTLILIPAYNAARYLPELIPRVLKSVAPDHFLIVNDGSSDNTAEILEQSGVTHINFGANRGKGEALKAGFQYAIDHGFRSVLTIDADLQHLPEEIPRFLERDDGLRVIMGTRHITLKVMPPERWLTNNLTSIIISIFSCARVRDSQSGYRLMPTWLLERIPMDASAYDLESQMLFNAGAVECPIDEVPVTTVYEGSHSYINPFIDSGRFIRQIWHRIWA